jgi:hypothetical protein
MAKMTEKRQETDQTVSVVIKVADSKDRVLQLNADGGIELCWDVDNFARQSEEVQRLLTPANLKRYLTAEIAADQRAASALKANVVENPFNPSGTFEEARLKVRKRAGWHQCWKSPGREFDAAIAGPYKQVRHPTEKQKADGYEIGEENGEVVKLLDGEGKVELIQVECRQELIEQYKQWMDLESTKRFQGIQNGFVNKIEEINSRVGGKDKKLTPILESTDVE